MHLYLIRHGIAADKATYSRDEDRPLTDKGRQQTRKVAKRLHKLGLKFNTILTSPLIRARETADILRDSGLSANLEESSELAPDGNISKWLEWLQQWRANEKHDCLAIVGHQPDLGNWAEILVWGSTRAALDLKKSGIIGLELPPSQAPVGSSQLFLLTSPKWLL